MFTLQGVSYSLPNKEVLFQNIDLAVNSQEKLALIGNNGVGKSTLLKILAQETQASDGEVSLHATPYFIPQNFGQFNHLTVAEALGIAGKLKALQSILAGDLSEENYTMLQDDWTIEDRCSQALAYWQLENIDLSQKLGELSGGQKTKVFLSGIAIYQPELVLLDEPSNHLDQSGRELLVDFIKSTKSTLVVVSHDRRILNLLNKTCELSPNGVKIYGGNYDFYAKQIKQEREAMDLDIQSKEKALQKAKIKERESLERQNKLDNRGRGKQEKAGVARIMMNTLRNKAENSTSKMKEQHADKISGLSKELTSLRSSLPELDKIKFGFDNSQLHKGKILFKASGINFGYNSEFLWEKSLDLEFKTGDRVAIKGTNGSGKTTLINLVLGRFEPIIGSCYRADISAVYIDQEYSLLSNKSTVFEQAQAFNSTALQEHEVKIRLHRFLFDKEVWDKKVASLSGGERMRLILCCLTIGTLAPDLIILDEPTNNLDLQNIEIVTGAIRDYQGTLVVVSHDERFLEEIAIEKEIVLELRADS